MRLFSIIIIFFFFYNNTIAQPCNFPFSPSNTCQTAPYVCTLDNYCASNVGAVNSGTPNAFCGIVENNNWVKFVAGSTSFEIKINITSCNLGNGLQAQFFSTTDCQNFTAVSNCLNPVLTTGNLVADNLVIGETYYFMMDGKNGDVCDYNYELITGEILSPASVFVDPVSVLCENGTLDINSTAVSPNSNLSYAWSTADGQIISDTSSSSITVSAPGFYQIEVEDDQGCQATTVVEVIQGFNPALSFDPISALNCQSNLTEVLQVNVVGGNAGYDYLWTTMDGNILSGADMSNPEVDAPGHYSVIVTNQITGCFSVGNIAVTADVNTPFALSNFDGELNCLFNELTLDGSGSSTGINIITQWSTTNGNIVSGENTLNPIVDEPGTYELLITNVTNGCTSTASSIITLNSEEPTGAEITIQNPCFGETDGSIIIDSVFGGIAPYQYSFDAQNFGGSNEINFLEPDTYPIIIQDVTGCEWTTTATIELQDELIVELGNDIPTLLGCEIELKAQLTAPISQIAEVNWSPDLGCDLCIDTFLTPLNEVTYTIEVIDVNGCVAYDTVSILVQKDRNVFIPNAFSPNEDGINDQFLIYGGKDVAKVITFKVFNRWGELVKEHNNFQPNNVSHSWDGKLNKQSLSENVFVYYAEVLFIDGWVEVYKGDVTLMR